MRLLLLPLLCLGLAACEDPTAAAQKSTVSTPQPIAAGSKVSVQRIGKSVYILGNTQ